MGREEEENGAHHACAGVCQHMRVRAQTHMCVLPDMCVRSQAQRLQMPVKDQLKQLLCSVCGWEVISPCTAAPGFPL